jgi:UDP-glucose 4-epimerase
MPAKYQPARPGEVRHSRAAIDRAQECLGYEPVVDFETGMRLTVAYYTGPRRTPRPRLAPSLRA